MERVTSTGRFSNGFSSLLGTEWTRDNLDFTPNSGEDPTPLDAGFVLPAISPRPEKVWANLGN